MRLIKSDSSLERWSKASTAAGFATLQEALRRRRSNPCSPPSTLLENGTTDQPYLVEQRITEADWRLFTHLGAL